MGAMLPLLGVSSGGIPPDLINVVSLPAPVLANPKALYHLSKDDTTYVLKPNGSALNPVHLPGWSRRDGADDDEFEGANTDPPSGFTWDNQDSATVNTNNERKSFTIVTKGNNSTELSVLYKNVPASPNKTYYACLQWGSDMKASLGSSAVGLIARNNTSGRILFLNITNVFSQAEIDVWRWTNSASPDVRPFSSAVYPSLYPGTYGILSLAFDGTNLAFGYAPHYQGGFDNIVTFYSEAVAAFLLSFDSFGFGVFNNGSHATKLFCNWLRVV